MWFCPCVQSLKCLCVLLLSLPPALSVSSSSGVQHDSCTCGTLLHGLNDAELLYAQQDIVIKKKRGGKGGHVSK